jgi:hypothetical protein
MHVDPARVCLLEVHRPRMTAWNNKASRQHCQLQAKMDKQGG